MSVPSIALIDTIVGSSLFSRRGSKCCARGGVAAEGMCIEQKMKNRTKLDTRNLRDPYRQRLRKQALENSFFFPPSKTCPAEALAERPEGVAPHAGPSDIPSLVNPLRFLAIAFNQ